LRNGLGAWLRLPYSLLSPRSPTSSPSEKAAERTKPALRRTSPSARTPMTLCPSPRLASFSHACAHESGISPSAEQSGHFSLYVLRTSWERGGERSKPSLVLRLRPRLSDWVRARGRRRRWLRLRPALGFPSFVSSASKACLHLSPKGGLRRRPRKTTPMAEGAEERRMRSRGGRWLRRRCLTPIIGAVGRKIRPGRLFALAFGLLLLQPVASGCGQASTEAKDGGVRVQREAGGERGCSMGKTFHGKNE